MSLPAPGGLVVVANYGGGEYIEISLKAGAQVSSPVEVLNVFDYEKGTAREFDLFQKVEAWLTEAVASGDFGHYVEAARL